MHVPADIIRGIATELTHPRSKSTLASLAQANKEAYDVCIPILYAEFEVSSRRSSNLLRLSPRRGGVPGVRR